MKKYLLLTGIFLAFNLQAQMLYKLTSSNGTYVPLNGGTDVSVAAWDSSHEVILPFSFKFFDKGFNSVLISSDGVYFTDTGMDYIYYSNDDLMPQDMDYTKSKIKFDVQGDIGDRILVAEYNNIREFNQADTSKDFLINMQIWLYEKANKIEFHFGPSTITDPQYKEFYMGLTDTDGEPFYGVDSVSGKLDLVDANDPGFYGLSVFPANGQVYTFSPINGSSIRNIDKPYHFAVNQKGFTVRCNDAFEMDIMDASGRKVKICQYSETRQLQNYQPDLGAGVYFINIRIGNKNFTEKILLY
ncbi:MAG: T9SS type A sorting domain-containing protein [Chitinophagaceae bacterium]